MPLSRKQRRKERLLFLCTHGGRSPPSVLRRQSAGTTNSIFTYAVFRQAGGGKIYQRAASPVAEAPRRCCLPCPTSRPSSSRCPWARWRPTDRAHGTWTAVAPRCAASSPSRVALAPATTSTTNQLCMACGRRLAPTAPRRASPRRTRRRLRRCFRATRAAIPRTSSTSSNTSGPSMECALRPRMRPTFSARSALSRRRLWV